MVRAFTFAAPQLGMLSPPPFLWLSSNIPESILRSNGMPSYYPLGTAQVFRANDQMLIKALAAHTKGQVPVKVVAMDDKSSSCADDESLSDSSSCRDSDSVMQAKNVTTHNIPSTKSSVISRKFLLPPPGRPLRAKPRLVNANYHKTTRGPRLPAKASVPLKHAVSKPRMLKRSALSQDEKLFVEAAATLVQTRNPAA